MTPYGYRFDYTKTMMMKMFLARPDRRGGSEVNLSFEKALELLRKTDALTFGVPKIVYLVGWQYNGHDDRYPDLFQVNDALKRPCDADARTSLLWLMEQAKQYHTTVSLHINLTDAYEDAALFPDFLAANALIRRKNGKPDPIENYNGKNCYKISYKEEWESGLFQKLFDRFLDFLPIREIGTLHVDNFQCYYNYAPDIDVSEMQTYRNKMLDYVRTQGIDVTSEFAYREGPAGREDYNHTCIDHPLYPIAALDRIPAVWWLNPMTDEDYLSLPPQRFGGGLPGDQRYLRVFYGNMHGEDIWQGEAVKTDDWCRPFLREFCMIQAPYFYLCSLQRQNIENTGDHKTAFFSDGIVAHSEDCSITKNGLLLKDEHSMLLPVFWKKNTWLAYSDYAADAEMNLPDCGFTEAGVSEITADGLKFLYKTTITDGKIRLSFHAGQALLIEKIV